MTLLARLGIVAAAVAMLASGATLERLTLERLILESTAIVRGRAAGSRVVSDGALLYTLYSFQVEQRLKGELDASVEIALPGGELDGVRQQFGGVPRLAGGREYLLFLWQGPSGRIQITGLSQGLFEVVRPDGAAPRALRASSPDVLLAPQPDGQPPADWDDQPLADLAAAIRAVLGAEGAGGP
jgi:hypothetical protein